MNRNNLISSNNEFQINNNQNNNISKNTNIMVNHFTSTYILNQELNKEDYYDLLNYLENQLLENLKEEGIIKK